MDGGVRLFLIAVLAVPAPIALNASELSDDNARRAAITAAASRTSGIRPDCPKTRRKEEIEEHLFSLRKNMISDEGKLNEAPFVYEVVEVGCYEVQAGSLIVHTIDHPGTYGFVAVDRISGRTYRLWPDPHAGNEFNRLIADVAVDVSDENSAISLANLYHAVVTGPYEGNVVLDRLRLKHLAEQSFYDAFPKAAAGKRFTSWWGSFEQAKGIRLTQTAKSVTGGWEVRGKSFERFSLTVPRTVVSGTASVREWSLGVSFSGQVTEMRSRVLFQQHASNN